MSIALRGMHAGVRPAAQWALDVAAFNGINPIVTSVFRSFTDQAQLRSRFERCVATGRFPSAPHCRFPANRPGDSSHNYGLSFDSVVPDAQLAAWTTIRQWAGFHVPSNDVIHGEVPGWRQYVSPPPRLAFR